MRRSTRSRHADRRRSAAATKTVWRTAPCGSTPPAASTMAGPGRTLRGSPSRPTTTAARQRPSPSRSLVRPPGRRDGGDPATGLGCRRGVAADCAVQRRPQRHLKRSARSARRPRKGHGLPDRHCSGRRWDRRLLLDKTVSQDDRNCIAATFWNAQDHLPVARAPAATSARRSLSGERSAERHGGRLLVTWMPIEVAKTGCALWQRSHHAGSPASGRRDLRANSSGKIAHIDAGRFTAQQEKRGEGLVLRA